MLRQTTSRQTACSQKNKPLPEIKSGSLHSQFHLDIPSFISRMIFRQFLESNLSVYMYGRFQQSVAFKKQLFRTKLLRLFYSSLTQPDTDTFPLSFRTDSQFCQFVIVCQIVHFAKSTYTYRLIFIGCDKNIPTFANDSLLWIIKSLQVVGLQMPMRSNPIFIQSSEYRLKAWIVRNNPHLTALSCPFGFFHSLEQTFLGEQLLPLFYRFP